MAIKWTGALVTAVSLAILATANVVVEAVSDGAVAPILNMLLIAAAAVGTVLVVVAELYRRLDSRLGVLSDFLVVRMEELESRLADHNAGLVEGYLARPNEPGSGNVVPLAAWAAKARSAPSADD